MSNTTNNNLFDSKTGTGTVSVRNPRQLFWVRMILFLGIVLSLDLGSSTKVKDESRYSKEWGVNFIAINQLHSQIIQKPIQTKVVVANELSVKSNPISSSISQKIRVSNQKAFNPASFVKTSSIKLPESRETTFTPLNLKNNLVVLNEYESIIYPEKIGGESFFHAAVSTSEILTEREISTSIIQSKSNWYVYGSIGPQVSKGKVWEPSTSSYEGVSGINELVANSGGESVSNYKHSFGSYLGIGFHLNKHWDVVSGLKYGQWNGSQTAYYDSEITRKQTITTAVFTNNTDGTKSFSNQAEEVEYVNYYSDTLVLNYRLSNVEIPLIIRYNFGNNKWNYFINSGFTVKISSQYSANYSSKQIGSGVISETQRLGSSFNALLGLGAEYTVGENIAIHLSPQFTKGIANRDNAGNQRKNYSAGLFLGLRYSVK